MQIVIYMQIGTLACIHALLSAISCPGTEAERIPGLEQALADRAWDGAKPAQDVQVLLHLNLFELIKPYNAGITLQALLLGKEVRCRRCG